ncbi:hypothetical protein [Sphingomonas sp. GM_Shp_2]|uniref:hypothetical protein n=1 Tax=Sphingomonas sp. GM_Shp_2 TaxID=2937380 RepID=UPI002269BBA2|nr:hypothetical protein [Sphingomonas sp. GM_Shp_2]
MTAEVAILNKSAVALAADSAVTISAGSTQEKIFDSADKLFELTNRNAIAVMVNSDMSLMEAPLAVLIKRYRDTAPRFSRVKEAAHDFLGYLNDFVKSSPKRIETEAIENLARDIFNGINNRAREAWTAKVIDPSTQQVRSEYIGDTERVGQAIEAEHVHQYEVIERAISSIDDASFYGDGKPVIATSQRAGLRALAIKHLPLASPDLIKKALKLVETAMRKRGVGGSTTGLIIAGFGDDDLFPTLIAFELYGTFGNRLKYAETEVVDIDRDGDKARVLPFAQREMVERFLYGLDPGIEQEITRFARDAIPSISSQLLDALDMSDEDRDALMVAAEKAERAFYRGLEEKAFQSIRQVAQEEIEDMVEFMPKPEMARMAEALVNLTSIKRRVSRGHETVGGPIDVAVISKADGFVWVRRKHYFPAELNRRYFDRMRAACGPMPSGES